MKVGSRNRLRAASRVFSIVGRVLRERSQRETNNGSRKGKQRWAAEAGR